MSDGPRHEGSDGAVPRGTGPAAAVLPSDDEQVEESMSFLDHLEDLRRVLIHSAVAGAVGAMICWFWSAGLLDLLVHPLEGEGVYFTAPNEAFMTRLKLAGICGLFLVLPFILWKIYGFILPGLYSKERRVVTPLLIVSTLLFYTGVAFSFTIVCPTVVRFLLTFGTSIMQPLIGIGPYFSFVAQLSLAFGLVFELPVLVFFLSMAGIVDPRLLLRTWRYAVIIIAVAAAVLTPPDIFSQLAMAVPVALLYISSVLVSIVATRRRRFRREADGEADDKADS